MAGPAASAAETPVRDQHVMFRSDEDFVRGYRKGRRRSSAFRVGGFGFAAGDQPSAYRGRSSVMVSHGAFESTHTRNCGRMPGSSSSAPKRIATSGPPG